MEQNIGESCLVVFFEKLQKAVDTPEILNCSLNRRMFLRIDNTGAWQISCFLDLISN